MRCRLPATCGHGTHSQRLQYIQSPFQGRVLYFVFGHVHHVCFLGAHDFFCLEQTVFLLFLLFLLCRCKVRFRQVGNSILISSDGWLSSILPLRQYILERARVV